MFFRNSKFISRSIVHLFVLALFGLSFLSSHATAKTKQVANSTNKKKVSEQSHHTKFEKLQELYKSGRYTYKSMATSLYQQKLYFSSLQFVKAFYMKEKKSDVFMDRLLEVLLVKAGTEALGDMPSDVLDPINSSTVKIILGRRAFYDKNFEQAYKYLNQIPDNHRLSPDAYILKGSMASLKNQKSEAFQSFTDCRKLAIQLKSDAKESKLKRYYDTLSELCTINKARVAFKHQEYQKSVDYYEQVPKVSYYWPYILLEMSWAHYHLENYNRVQGLLVTYKSPLLTSYFFPEAEILKSLAYFRMCLWDDSLKVIDLYYNVYRDRSIHLKNLLIKHKDSHTFFYDFIHTDLKKNEKVNPFIRNLVIMVRKKVKYHLDKNSYNWAVAEFKTLQELPSGELKTLLQTKVREEAYYRKAKINYFTKKLFFDFLNQIFRFSRELFNLRLEILSSQRHMLYKNEKFSEARERGSLYEVKRSSSQYVFGFNGEFWADELGDYSFGLKSNCKVEDRDRIKATIGKPDDKDEQTPSNDGPAL